MKLDLILESLVCPRTKKPLARIVIDGTEHEQKGLSSVEAYGISRTPIGVTAEVLKVEGEDEYYPIVDSFPVLMAPELLVPDVMVKQYESIDLNDPRYAEAYEEMTVYNAICEKMVLDATADNDQTEISKPMGCLTPESDLNGCCFPRPEDLWVDAKHDSLSQLEAYDYLAPIDDKIFLQLGGSGSHAVKALLAGASKAFLLTPMIGEAKVAEFLAKKFGVNDKLVCVIAIGEELPFSDSSIDVVYSGGCFHHMRLNYTAVELHRILKAGGKFSGVDPWKTPLHTIGTSIIGKREKSVFCKPITKERLQPMVDQFADITVSRHGPFLRYFFLALEKIGVDLSISTMLSIGRADDKIGRMSGLSKFGGSLMIAGRK